MTEATFTPVESVPYDVFVQLFEMLQGTEGNYMLSMHENTPEACYTYACPASGNLLGWEPEDLIGHPAYEFIHPDDAHPIEESHRHIMATKGARTESSYRLRAKSGEYIRVRSWSWVTDEGTIAITERMD